MKPRYEIRSLDVLNWGYPETGERGSGNQFRADWNDTVALLMFETEILGARTVVLQIDVDPRQIRRDGMLYANAGIGSFPGVKVSFDSTYGPLTYATDAYVSWRANVRAIALALRALRAVDRYGVGHSGEQYRGWAAIGSKPATQSDLTMADALLVFKDALRDNPPADLSTREAINRAYRAAAKHHHPDVTGNDQVWLLITRARDVLLAAAR